MNVNHWKILAKEIASEIKHGAKGIVVLHGTDTMSYTSAALSFMLQDLHIPVIVVGAQRSSDRPSSDNRMNLLNAAFAASIRRRCDYYTFNPKEVDRNPIAGHRPSRCSSVL